MMTNKEIPSFLKKIIVCSTLFLGLSCSNDELIQNIEDDVQGNSLVAKSNASVQLTINEVSASAAHANYPATKAIDGNIAHSSRWAGYGTNVDFNIDLGSQNLIDYLNIAFSGAGSVYSFQVYTSNDNSNWVSVGTKSSSGTAGVLEEFDVSNSTGRYVRINFKGSNQSDWNNVREIQVFGTKGAEEVVVNEEVSSGVVDFGDLQVETSWLTEDIYDRDTFDAEDVDGEDWMDVYNSGIVMMKCLAGESHRTELKERSGVEASLETYKKMSYTSTLTSVPNHGVTIAQIHNRTSGIKRPWIRVYVDADRYIRIKETLTTPWQTSDEGGSTYYTWTGPKYTSGNVFSVSITIENGEANFAIQTNGELHETTLSPDSDWDAYNNGYYLKAGVYTEGEDKQPQMKFSSFSIDY